jgi:hypothetical protein
MDMSNDNDPQSGDPHHWRQRAKEARELAERIPNLEAKQAMSSAAGHYEWLADRADEELAKALAEQQQTKPTE